MKLTEWLQSKGQNEQATFVIAKAVKDEFSPMYHNEYRTTPIRCVWEWAEGLNGEKYIVINADYPPIEIAGHWLRQYNAGHLLCAIITTEADLYTQYSETQAKEMLEWYDKEVRKQMQK